MLYKDYCHSSIKEDIEVIMEMYQETNSPKNEHL